MDTFIDDEKAAEIQKTFSYNGYQTVRRELFAHLREPQMTIRKDSITFNTACIEGLEDTVYIQILVNQDQKRLVIKKCEKDDRDSLRWCIQKNDKRKSRKITGRQFCNMIYKMIAAIRSLATASIIRGRLSMSLSWTMLKSSVRGRSVPRQSWRSCARR